MRRLSAGTAVVAVATLLAIALAVLFVLRLTAVLPAPGASGSATPSTLDGGVVTGESGWSIRETTDEVPGAGGFEFPRIVVVDERHLYLEAGGSGSADCRSNFSGIELVDGELRLAHRVGDGTAEVCTDDYRFTYFEIAAEGSEDLGDVEAIVVMDGDERRGTYASDDWLSGEWTER